MAVSHPDFPNTPISKYSLDHQLPDSKQPRTAVVDFVTCLRTSHPRSFCRKLASGLGGPLFCSSLVLTEQEPVITTHPRLVVFQCLDVSDQRLGYSSSLDLPERVLQFARDHPLMAGTVKAIGQKPVLLKRGTKYTRLVVHRTIGVDNATYSVLFLGTGQLGCMPVHG